MQDLESPDVLLRRAGSAGRITLNRPRFLNALTLEMVRSIAGALDRWERDPEVGVVVLDGAGPRGLCAGGDIRVIHASGRARDGLAEMFWREEYELIGRIARFPKPVVTIMSGLVMGAGVGLSAHGPHRVVTETAVVAMPEVGIGLLPDVGGTWLFSRAPGEIGTYLALTGERMGPADAIALGLGDVSIPEAQLEGLGRALEALPPGPEAAARVDAVLRSHAQPAGPSRLLDHDQRATIDGCFGADSVEEIVERLAAAGSEFAAETGRRLDAMSPTSLKVTLAALRQARGLSTLEACLAMEYAIVCHLLDGHDFYEGVRAAVIDKDRNPRWQPARLEEVAPGMVEAHFALAAGRGSAPPFRASA